MDRHLRSCLYKNSALVRFFDKRGNNMGRKSVLNTEKVDSFMCIACGLRFNSAKDFIQHRSDDFQPGTGRKCYSEKDLDMLGINFRSTVI